MQQIANGPTGACIRGLAALFAAAACGGEGTAADGDSPAEASDEFDGAEYRPPVDGYAERSDTDPVDDGGRPPSDDYSDTDGGPTEDGEAATCHPPLGGPCDAVEQCGCRSGDRCVLDYTGRTRPVEACVAAGTDRFGAVCDDGVDNCARGSQCHENFAPAECTPYCHEDLNCPIGWRCAGPAPGLVLEGEYHFCERPPEPCDPFTAEGCAPGETCVVREEETACRLAAPAGPGEPCDGTCAPGSYCPPRWHTGPYPADVCLKYCRLGGGLPDCSDVPGTVCAAGLGRPDVGLCL